MQNNILKSTIFFIYIFFTLNLYSQEIKIYKGKYKDGFAEYEYFENSEMERVLNGNFKYTWKESVGTGWTRNKMIVGKYLNNKKNGVWQFETRLSNEKLKLINDIETLFKGNFINNLKNGVWELKNYEFPVKPNIVNGFSMGSKLEPKKLKISISTTVKNDTVVNLSANSTSFSGKTDDLGNFIGDWLLKLDDREINFSFNKNILIKLLDKKKSTGEIYSKYFPNFVLTDFDSIINNYIKITFERKYTKGENDIHNDQEYDKTNILTNIAGIPNYDVNKNDYRFGIDNSLNELINRLLNYIKLYDSAGNAFSEQDDDGNSEFYGNTLKLKYPELLFKKSED